MRGGKTQNSVGQGQGKSQMTNRNINRVPIEGQLKAQQGFPVQGIMMQQRANISGHPQMAIQHPMRPTGRNVYSSSPQGPGLHYANVPQQNIPFPGMMPPQDQYMARQFRPSVQYNMQSANYPHFVQQQCAYSPNMQLYYPSQQQQQQQKQQQQLQQQSSVNSYPVQSNNMNKPMERPKSKRSSTKIIIKDPTKDTKDCTDVILARASTSSNGKVVGTRPLSSNSGVRSDSSIQAAFAANVAAISVTEKSISTEQTGLKIVLNAQVPQNKMGPPRDYAMSEFLPSYARQNSQLLKKCENRWTRPHEREIGLSIEEKITAELFREVAAILNKLTPQKFKTLIEQCVKLKIDTPERLEGVVDRIFEKAIREPMYSVAYANMCRCLLQIKVSGPDDDDDDDDDDDEDVTFRKLLLNRCQKEFEKETLLEGLSEEEKKIKRDEMDEEASKNKRRMLGNVKFIGELFRLKLLTERIMHDCIFKLLRAGDDESLESMCILLFTIGKDLDCDRAKPRIDQYFDAINKIILGKKASLKVSFMLRDVVDLRKNNWVPRHEENFKPKTIDQIHKEEKTLHTRRLQKKGRCRDSPKPTQSSSDGWIVSGRGGKPVPIDTNKLKNIGKRAPADDTISLGPTGRSLAGMTWGRGSTGGLGNSGSASQEQEVPGNRFSALSGEESVVFNRPYDPRKPCTPTGRSSAGARTGDKRQVRSDRDSAIQAVKFPTKPQMKSEVVQSTFNVKGKADTKMTKEIKDKIWPSLTTEEMTKKTKAILDMFVNVEDMEKALTCFTDLKSSEVHHVFVSTAIEHMYEFDSRARQLTGCLFNELLLQRRLDKEQFSLGLGKALEFAEDNSIDYSKRWCYLAETITPVIVGNQFKLADLKPLIVHLVECNKADVLLAEILTIIAKESVSIEDK